MSNPWDRRLGFWWIAEDQPGAMAILASPQGTRTYGELAGDAHQLVHLFRARGAQPGDAVAALVDNGITIIEVSIACQESGLHFIPLNTHLTSAELASIIAHSGTKILVADPRFAPIITGAGVDEPGTVVLFSEPVDGADDLPAARASMPRTAPDDRRPGGLFVYTSGTTGKPKGIRRPIPDGDVDRLANGMAVFGRAFDFRPFEGPMLVSTGMFHGGSHSYYMGGLHVGHALVIMDKFDAEQVLRLIAEYHIRTAYMVPTQFHRLLQLPADVRSRYDVSSLHSVVHSAAPCPRPVKEQMMAWWGPVIWETYGGMEGAATIAKPHHWLAKPGTVGRPIRGVRVFILDEDGNELPPGEDGEIFMDNGVGFSYHDDPDQTRSVHRGSRFSLGDVGHLDEDGFLFVTGRSKDMIITGGTNVYPAEIEAVLLEHPSVHDAAVIGIPDDDWGETVTALVQLVPGGPSRERAIAELDGLCRDRLASYKVPRRWEFRDDMPRTEAGKLYKHKIRHEYLAAAETTEAP